MAETMRAAVATAAGLEVTQVPAPRPGPGQALVRSLACGLCGSDLHFLEILAGAGDSLPPFVLGHEFCVEVVEYGAGGGPVPVGQLACSVPYVTGGDGPQLLGFSATYPGGFAEYLLLDSERLMPVPDGLDPQLAALTEPLAVGEHAAGLDPVPPDVPAVVLGAGPVGLAVVLALLRRGRAPVVVSDPSPFRRDAASRLGAVVVDPGQRSPWEAVEELAPTRSVPSPLLSGERAVPLTVFDCVGRPGIMAEVISAVPTGTRIVVAGACTDPDTFVPAVAVTKEVELRYSYAYRGDEFAATLQALASGALDGRPLITDIVGLSAIGDAVTRLRSAERDTKILIDPQR
jgi:2-desacetyl-2-hydroxyethyl bacteriochlorophyllide A dehydrogenase